MNIYKQMAYLMILMMIPFFLLSAHATETPATVENSDVVLGHWSFDDDTKGYATNNATNKRDSVYGRYERVDGVTGKALSFDGFRTYIRTARINQQNMTEAFTVEAWIAPAMYPWSWSPVYDCSDGEIRGFFFGIDNLGRVGFKIAAGSAWYEAVSKATIPLRKWTHIAAVFRANDQMAVYINGEPVASTAIDGLYAPPTLGYAATIGRNYQSQVWIENQLTTPDTHFFLDGLLDEVTIVGYAKTGMELRSQVSREGTLAEPVLSERGVFPKGPLGSGSFGAYYTKLDYYKEWDDMWRVSNKPDVFVRFDSSPVQLVFWRGTSFVPHWVSENDIWYNNEWLETWGSDVVSCAEPNMDNQARHSHVRIIENTDARVVVHWRYALVDAFYNFAAITDDGRGEWCDEYYIIYPDHVGIRRMELHYSKPERRHDWVEQIVLTAPGQYPEDLIEHESITLLNMEGDVKAYPWNDQLEIPMTEPAGANISYVNLKSEYRPFFVIPPGPVNTVEGTWNAPWIRSYAPHQASHGYRPNPAPTNYGWWNHWPVSQIAGDGRWITVPDRPGHFNLSTFVQWNDLSKTDKTRTRIMLQGMTSADASTLVPLAKSWLQAPEMTGSSENIQGGTYDEAERAYLLEKTANNETPIELTLNGSEESPVINPAFVIKNWGGQHASLSVDGVEWTQGENFRQGIRKGLEGEDLIVWIRLNSQSPVTITLE